MGRGEKEMGSGEEMGRVRRIWVGRGEKEMGRRGDREGIERDGYGVQGREGDGEKREGDGEGRET